MIPKFCSIHMAVGGRSEELFSRRGADKRATITATAMKSVVVDSSLYDWEGDTPLNHPPSQTIIYKMHVRGFTQHPSSGVKGDKRYLSRTHREDPVSPGPRYFGC